MAFPDGRGRTPRQGWNAGGRCPERLFLFHRFSCSSRAVSLVCPGAACKNRNTGYSGGAGRTGTVFRFRDRVVSVFPYCSCCFYEDEPLFIKGRFAGVKGIDVLFRLLPVPDASFIPCSRCFPASLSLFRFPRLRGGKRVENVAAFSASWNGQEYVAFM